MKKPNYEDFIMKRAMDLFAEEGLKFFGVDKKVKAVGSTELVVLELKNMFMDYTFLMEDDTIIHFEFQTTDKGILDLRRFRSYEALLSYQTGKDVTTYVVYSGNINDTVDTLETGVSTYKVKGISLVTYDEDIIFEKVMEKARKGIELERQEVIALAFTPVMGGKLNKQEKILKAIRLTKQVDEKYRYDLQSILYAFANKFLEGKELDKVREELKMTELGKSLIEEGMQEGMQKGIEKGKLEVAKTAIGEGLDDETISRLTGIPIEEIKILRNFL
ncbi:MAG: hypothetical protein AB9856_14875 [Cellulosilyticaceae bacterium]